MRTTLKLATLIGACAGGALFAPSAAVRRSLLDTGRSAGADFFQEASLDLVGTVCLAAPIDLVWVACNCSKEDKSAPAQFLREQQL